MKIAFRLDADNRTGMGHAYRCSALADALAAFGCECVFFSRDNEKIRAFAAARRIGFEAAPVAGLSEEMDFMKTALIKYDMLIIDSYAVSDWYIDTLNKSGGFAVACVDDNALYRYSCDVLINGNLHAKELEYRVGDKKPLMLLGGEYTLLRDEFSTAEPIKVRDKANRVFVCFGGSDPHNFTSLAVKTLKVIPDIEITAVLGFMAACAYDEIHAAKNVAVIKDPASISDVMRSCDIAVTACGSMVYELAALGMPSVSIVQADNQKIIAEYLNKNALMKVIDYLDKTKMKFLCYEVESLLNDFKRREQESLNLKKTISRHGAQNVARKLIEIIKGAKNGNVLQ
jgi:UDP-2,4-diacetamido-2,4,6-trideoxy-beta-L-altropyranose hydrolase